MLHINILQFQDFFTPRIIGFQDYITLTFTQFQDFVTPRIIGFQDYITLKITPFQVFITPRIIGFQDYITLRVIFIWTSLVLFRSVHTQFQKLDPV